MCKRCADIDYPVNPVFLPCYQPPGGPRRRSDRNARGGFSEEDFSEVAKIQNLINTIKQQRREIMALKACLPENSAVDFNHYNIARRFEGVEYVEPQPEL